MIARAATAPRLISAAVAERLLDELIYDRVVELVDLAGLHRLECFLGFELYRLGLPTAELCTVARTMVDRALERLASDEDRYRHVASKAPEPPPAPPSERDE